MFLLKSACMITSKTFLQEKQSVISPVGINSGKDTNKLLLYLTYTNYGKCPTSSDKMAYANSVDPDQTAV